MTMHRHFQRQHRFSLRENRLLHEAPTIEVLSERMIDILRNSPANAQDLLQQLLQNLEPSRQQDFLAGVRQNFSGLQENVQRQISLNLESLSKTSTAELVRRQLESLKTTIATAHDAAEKSKGFFGDAMDRTQKFFSDSWHGAEEWWNERSPEAKSNVKGVGIAVGAAAAVYGIFKIGKWLFGSAKKVEEKTVEKAKKWGTGALILGGLALVGITGFIGFKQMEKFFTERVNALKKQADDMKRAAEEKIAQAQQAGQEELQRMGKQVAAVGEAVSNRPSVRTARNNAGVIATHFALEHYLQDDKVRDVLPAMERSGWKVSDMLALYDADTGTANRSALAARADAFVPERAVDREAYIDAAAKLIAFCGKHAALMRKAYEADPENKGKKFDDVTIQDYVEEVGSSLLMLFDISMNIKDLQNFDFQTSIDKMARNGKSVISKGLGSIEVPNKKPFPEELKDITPTEVIEFAVSQDLAAQKVSSVLSQRDRLFSEDTITALRAQLGNFQTQLSALPPKPTDENADDTYSGQRAAFNIQIDKCYAALRFQLCGKALCEICENYLPEPAFLAPFFHETFPDKDWNPEDLEANYDAIRAYLQDGMSVGKVLRLFSYERMIATGQPSHQSTAIAALQFEILQFIDEKDEGEWWSGGYIKIKQKEALIRMIEKLGDSDYWASLQKATGVSIEVLQETLPLLRGPAQQLLEVIAFSLLGTLREGGEWYLALKDTHPWLFWGTAVPGTAYAGWKASAPLRWYGEWRLSRTNLDFAIHGLVTTREARWWTPGRSLWYQMNPLVNHEARRAAGKQLDLLKDGIRILRGTRADTAEANLLKWFRNGAFPDELVPQFIDPLKQELQLVEEQISQTKAAGRSIDDLERLAERLRRIIQDADDLARLPEHEIARRALMRYARPIKDYPSSACRAFYEKCTGRQLRQCADELLEEIIYLRQAQRYAPPDAAAEIATRLQELLDDPLLAQKQFQNLLREGYGNAGYLNDLKQGRIGLEQLDSLIDVRLRNFPGVDDLKGSLRFIEELDGASSRLFYYRELLGRNASVVDLVRAGAGFDDLAGAGIDARSLINAALHLDDLPARQIAIGELLRAGYADDVIEACAAKGTEYIDELKEVAQTSDGLTDDVLRRISELKPRVPPVALIGVSDEAVRSATALATALDEVTGVPRAWLESGNFAKEINTLRAGYADEALDAFTEATRRMTAIEGMTPKAALDLLKEARVVHALSGSGPMAEHAAEAIRAAMIAYPSSPVKAAQRCIVFLAMLGDAAPAATRSAKVLSFIANWTEADPALIQKVVNHLHSAADPNTVLRVSKDVATKAKLALENADEMVRVLEQARFAHKFSLGRVAWTTGVPMGLEVIGLAFDIVAYNEARERIDNAKKTLEQKLGTKDFTVSRNGNKTTYRHKTSAIEICLNEIFARLEEGDNQNKVRIWTSATSLAATTLVQGIALVAPSLSLGPAGWVIAGAVITVHVGSMIVEQGEQRRLLATLPMPVLQLIGMAGAVGSGEFDTWAGVSNGMISDMLSSSAHNEREKRLIRKKAIGLLFAQELGTLSKEQPGFYLEVLGEDDPFSFVREGGDFFSEDFEKVVGPYLSIRMFQLANDSGAKWAEFRDLKIDEGWWDFTNVDIEDVRIALRESAILYVQHLREKRYRRMNIETNQYAQQYEDQYRTEGKKITKRDGIRASADQEMTLEDRIARRDDMGRKTVLGTRAERLSYENINDPTQVERMITSVYGKLDANSSHITTYQGIDSGQTIEEEIITPRSGFDVSYFSAAIPAGLLPGVRQRSEELWLVPYLSIAADAEQNPELRRKTFIEKLRAIRSGMKPWHMYRIDEKDRQEGLTDTDHRRIMDAYALFQTYPEFDPSGQIRSLLQTAGTWKRGMVLEKANIAVALPEGLLPEIGRRSVPLWQLLYLTAPESTETEKGKRYDDFMARARASFEQLYKFEQRVALFEYIHAEDYQYLLEYCALLNEYPEFDADRAVRNAILALPQYDWVQRFPTDEHPREGDLRVIARTIATHIREKEYLHYQYHPFDRGAQHREYVRVGDAVESPDKLTKLLRSLEKDEHAYFSHPDVEALYGQRNAREIFVVTGDPTEGNKQVFRAGVAPDTNTTTSGSYHVDGAGTLIWVSSSVRHDSGRVETGYRWYLKADPTPCSFYVGHNNARRIEQPGARFETHEKTVQHEVLTGNAPYYAFTFDYAIVVDLRFRDGTVESFSLDNAQDHIKLRERCDVIKTKHAAGGQDQWLLIPKEFASLETITLRSRIASNSHQTVITVSETPSRLPRRIVEMHREAVKHLNLVEVSEGVYTREGYAGRYLLQPDGSVFWTGGKIPSGKLLAPMTYFDGVWLRTEQAALNETDSRLMLLPGSPFTAPKMAYRIACFDHNRRNVFSEELRPGEPVPEAVAKHFTVTESDDGQWLFTPKSIFQGSVELTTFRREQSVRVLYPSINQAMLNERTKLLTKEERETGTVRDMSVRPLRLHAHISPELVPYERADSELPESFSDTGVEYTGHNFRLRIKLKDGREVTYALRGGIDDGGDPYIGTSAVLAGSDSPEETVWADERLPGALGQLMQLRFVPDQENVANKYDADGRWQIVPRHPLVESYAVESSQITIDAKRTSETFFERTAASLAPEFGPGSAPPPEAFKEIDAGTMLVGDTATVEGLFWAFEEVVVTLQDGTKKNFIVYKNAANISEEPLKPGEERLQKKGITLYRYEQQDRDAANKSIENPYQSPERVFPVAVQEYLSFVVVQRQPEGSPFLNDHLRFTVTDKNVRSVVFRDSNESHTYTVRPRPE